MSTFWTSLTPPPAKDKGIPYTWFTKLLDNTLALKQGDQAFDYLLGSQVNITDTGTVNNHNPAGMDVAWSGASQLVITGIVPRANGDIRIYRNVTTAQSLAVSHENGSSTATNRIKLPAAVQFIGPSGSIGLKYDGTAQRWFLLFVNPGKPIEQAYSAGLFTAGGGGTWTFPSGAASLITFAWSQLGAWMDVEFQALNTTTAGTVTYLSMPVPGGFTAAKTQGPSLVDARSNGVYVPARLAITGGASGFTVYRQDRANWPAGVGNNDLEFSARIHIT